MSTFGNTAALRASAAAFSDRSVALTRAAGQLPAAVPETAWQGAAPAHVSAALAALHGWLHQAAQGFTAAGDALSTLAARLDECEQEYTSARTTALAAAAHNEYGGSLDPVLVLDADPQLAEIRRTANAHIAEADLTLKSLAGQAPDSAIALRIDTQRPWYDTAFDDTAHFLGRSLQVGLDAAVNVNFLISLVRMTGGLMLLALAGVQEVAGSALDLTGAFTVAGLALNATGAAEATEGDILTVSGTTQVVTDVEQANAQLSAEEAASLQQLQTRYLLATLNRGSAALAEGQALVKINPAAYSFASRLATLGRTPVVSLTSRPIVANAELQKVLDTWWDAGGAGGAGPVVDPATGDLTARGQRLFITVNATTAWLQSVKDPNVHDVQTAIDALAENLSALNGE